jgi:squalene cyclase
MIRGMVRVGRVIEVVALVSSLQISGMLAAQQESFEANTEKRAARTLSALWTREVELSVDRGLVWLAKRQDKRGFWFADAGAKGNDWRYDNYNREMTVEMQRMRGSGHIGVTALAGMAFLAGGHLPGRGKYGALVKRTLKYVLDHVGENGLITDSGTRMYSHALATLFLAEVYGMSREKRIKKALEDAVHMICDSQNVMGGWRYYLFSSDSDLSITVCQVQALRAARNIGIQVPKSNIDRAVKYVLDSRVETGPSAGLYDYKIRRNRDGSRRSSGRRRKRKELHFAINAAAVTSLLSAGVHDQKWLARPVDHLLERLEQEIEEFQHHYQFWYGNYYACQALFHADRLVRKNAFKIYYDRIKDHLLSDQQDDGRWLNDEGPGDPFSTAVACIVLQVPKQYLPIFQR